MRVEFANYLLVDTVGRIVADLDVLPRCHHDHIVGARAYVFDR